MLALLLGAAMLRPAWRLPALVVALLCLPGNMDDTWPQMRLDPHPLPTALAPVFTAADLLLVWALALTLRERRRIDARIERWLLAGTLVVAALAALMAVLALVNGVEPAAALRGIVTFARLPAIVALVLLTAHALGDGRWLAIAFAVGAVGLIGNGIYTTEVQGTSRFTAATFGVNGFAVALAVSGLVAGSIALAMANTPSRRQPMRVAAAAGFAVVGAAALMLVPATGTRMAIIAIIAALAAAFVINRTWLRRGQRWKPVAVVAIVFVAVTAGGIYSPEGGRAIAVVTNPRDTVDIVTRPGEQPIYEPARTRYEFWQQARAMVMEQPLTGVGPFQWNIVRYTIDPGAPRAVADPHNTILQIAAEYGLIVTIAYVVLLGILLLTIAWFAFQRRSLAATVWTATALVVVALIFPLTEMTNSHLFNVRLGPTSWILLAAAVVLSRTSLANDRESSLEVAQ